MSTTKSKMKRRHCKNCDDLYQPAREWQEFCGPACKKQFWRAGGFSVGRLRPLLAEMVAEAVKAATAPLLARIEAAEAHIEKLRRQ